MTKRYYKFDDDGKPIASYYRQQPGISGLVHIEESPGEFYLRSGEVWVDDVPGYLKHKIAKARDLATGRWIDSSKAVTAIQANYNGFVNGSYSSIEEVDSAYDSFVNWLNLRELDI